MEKTNKKNNKDSNQTNKNKTNSSVNLDENIKNGNSLVDMSYARFNDSVYSDISLMNKLKMFDWNNEFGNRKFE